MFDSLKELFIKIIKSRLTVLFLVMIILAAVLVQHLFKLQIVKGQEYQENFSMQIEKKRTLSGTRGDIFDRNGKLLASNELSYTVTIEDNGTYQSTLEKNQSLNQEFDQLIDMITENGDEIVNDFPIIISGTDKKGNPVYQFTVEGTALQRFRADIFGRQKIEDLKFNKKLNLNEAAATAGQMVDYLCSQSSTTYDIRLEGTEDAYKKSTSPTSVEPEYYPAERRFEIMKLRYALAQNAYQKYVTTDVATDVSDKTVAMIKEHADHLQGVEIAEDTKRVYYHPEYFSHIIGYTGKVSEEEYEKLHAEDKSYEPTDIVGRSGIEKTMEAQLKGTKGSETVYVDNLGKVKQVKDVVASGPGNDVYLSIDAELQAAVYDLLEQELAGILYSKIRDIRTTTVKASSDVVIPIYDVYKALIGNSVIDSKQFADADADSIQADIYQTFLNEKKSVIPAIETALKSDTPYEDLSDEMQEYMKYIISKLQSSGIFDADKVDGEDEIYQQWKKESISVREYLEHAIDQKWMDITVLNINDRYAVSDEVYQALLTYISEEISGDSEFEKLVYEALIMSDKISGRQLCLILYEQGILSAEEDSDYEAIRSGSMSAYTFLRKKIQNLDITPAQLALNPCTGSCVITDPNTGELLACVSYPGYDNNKLANVMDTEYYNKLNTDGSHPLYNYATQQTTAPGSTFKMVTAVAALTEGVITPSTEIQTKGQFEKIHPSPKCWKFPSNHGSINVAEAIRDSCNYFFYDLGYRLSLSGETYQEEKGVNILTKYAEEFGFGSKTGVEIDEYSPHIADEYPVTMAIGQSNNNFTTIQLARYASAVANSGTVYNMTLLKEVRDPDGKTLETYGPTEKNVMNDVSDAAWDSIHYGMKMVVDDHSQFDDLTIQVAGKTGTAQQANTPNHALFVGYAPYENPQIAIATRIACGYTSANTADLSAKIFKYYFGLEEKDDLLNGKAANVGSSSNAVND